MAGGTIAAPGLIVVVDASVIVSAVLKTSGLPLLAVEWAFHGQNRLIISDAVEAEYRFVLARPKFDRYAPTARREAILNRLLGEASRIEPTALIRECRDPADDKYLSLAAAGRADVIVTGDKAHLLGMDPWRGVRILSPAAFLAL